MSIKCQVEECHFNDKSQQLCQADAIQVRSSGTMSVADSENTACDTFKPKNK
ncbi:DUF1540 domain-containing protein [Metallumcola ferriviriculae]|uniref:DUF1540 domain-containing protein n=1 Tax=Metallumcola ferriviriculae TaxID=3039180 RepID=A0AAU0UNP8_9FIRM|nr:DUF1540 domain-containing protein [Desulfitibacteraceae bacterium MK1]